MSAYRLETFAPADGLLRSRRSPLEQRLEAVREEAWHAGFLEGQAMATEAHLDDQTRLTSELIEAIADSRLTNEAARRHVAASVAPMLESLVAAITPTLAQAGLGKEIARLVERALLAAPEARPRLRCAPELLDTIEAALTERGLAATIEEAPELLPREAQVFWDQGYDHLDLDACTAQIRACIASHLKSNAGEDDDPRQYG
jgi:hypothetical protein